MKRTVLLQAIVVMTAFVWPAAGQSRDLELGDLYYRQAQRLWRQQQAAESSRLVEIGLQYDERSGDLLTLHAELALREAPRTREAVEALEHALLEGRFNRRSRDEAVELLAAVLVRTGAHDRALRWIADHARDRLAADLLYQEIRALLGLQRWRQADARIAAGLRRYPEDARFVRLAIEREPLPGFAVARWLDEYRQPENDREYLRVLRFYAASLSPGEQQQRRLEQYFAYGGTSPAAVAAYLRYADDAAAELDRFRRFGGFETKEYVVSFYEAMAEGPPREALGRELAAFNGTMYGSRDEYGFPRERFSFEDGLLVRYELDEQRDGVYDHVIQIRERLPVSYRLSNRSVALEVEFHAYPEVATVARREPDANEFRYVVVPGRFRFPVVRFGAGWFDTNADALERIVIDDSLALPAGTALREHAARIEERRPGAERAHEITYLDGGEVYRVTSDTTGDGRIDLVVEYRDNRPFFGLRDVTGDGYFELLKRYRDGVLVEVALDENRDGVYTYFEEPGPPLRISWDLLQDGRIDVRETYQNDRLIGREYQVAPGVRPETRDISPWSTHDPIQ